MLCTSPSSRRQRRRTDPRCESAGHLALPGASCAHLARDGWAPLRRDTERNMITERSERTSQSILGTRHGC
jgi:hypothetical protein